MPENIFEQIKIIEESRARMHRHIDEKYDAFLEALRTGQSVVTNKGGKREFSLASPPAIFKGEKPESVTLANGEAHEAKTWRALVLTVLKDCNADTHRHEQMMCLRNRIGARLRIILTDDASKLDVPLKIDEGLYVEGKFDTEYLLKMLNEHIFQRVGYDCKDITVTLREESATLQLTVEHDNEEDTVDELEELNMGV